MKALTSGRAPLVSSVLGRVSPGCDGRDELREAGPDWSSTPAENLVPDNGIIYCRFLSQ